MSNNSVSFIDPDGGWDGDVTNPIKQSELDKYREAFGDNANNALLEIAMGKDAGISVNGDWYDIDKGYFWLKYEEFLSSAYYITSPRDIKAHGPYYEYELQPYKAIEKLFNSGDLINGNKNWEQNNQRKRDRALAKFNKYITVPLRQMYQSGASPATVQTAADILAQRYQSKIWLHISSGIQQQNNTANNSYSDKHNEVVDIRGI